VGLVIGSKVTGVSGALTQTGSLALDGAASLALAGQAQIGGSVQVGGGSKLTAAGGLEFANNNASLWAIAGSAAQFASFSGYGTTTSYGYTSYTYYNSTIGVDATSSIEFGTAGSATKGALTIDSGVTANLLGAIDGNVVVNGTVILQGALAFNAFGTAAPSVTGAGTIELTEGSTLTLAGSDSVAIQFTTTYPSGGNYSGQAETLALTGSLPTGTISGFAQGDWITVAQTVTGLSYSQTSSAAGTLTLLDGSTTVGTLSLAGSYTASQFQVQLSACGLASTISYSPAPSTISGNQISSNSHSYSWTNASGGVWSNAANWTDTTLSGTPTAAPSAGNAVNISDTNNNGSGAQIISGSGAAASLSVDSSTVFTGSIAVFGQFTVDNYNSGSVGVAIAGGGIMTAGSLQTNSALQVGGGSALTVSGSASVYGNITVLSGSNVQVTGQSAGSSDYLDSTIAVDGSSSFEFGAAGKAAKGALTIDNGQSPTLDGGTLLLNAADSAAIAFQQSPSGMGGAYATLELAGPLPTGTISGFAAGDAIQVDQTVSGVSYQQATGTLTLTDGATIVGTLTLSGDYSTSLFHVDVAAASGLATISVQTATTATGSAAADTGTDAYSWTGNGGGSWWNDAGDWQDTTSGNPATDVPGSGNAVTIAGNTGAAQYTTIGGNGAAASLAVTGNVLLTGQTTVGAQATVAAASALALDVGATLTAGSAAITGTLSAGHGSSATITGTATLSGGSLLALDGSTVDAGVLIANDSSNVIAVDGNSTLQVGAPGAAPAGALTIHAGATAALTGAIYGSVDAIGTLAVEGGGALFIDLNGAAESDPYAAKAPTISGAGSLTLAEGSTLGLGVVDSTAITFAGPNATLQLAAIPTATITGFAVGDQIQVDETVTGLSYKQVTASSATLTLTNGATTVGTLALAGSYGGSSAFHLDTPANGGSAVISLQSLGVAATRPTLIQGTAGSDLLTATANSQTLTGLGGGDTLNGGAFTGIDFKDLTANLNGSTIQDFATSDLIDFTDMTASKAKATYAGGVLSVTDGTHAAALTVGFGTTPATGTFSAVSDGAGGTKVTWH
jgi:hypothetical protein